MTNDNRPPRDLKGLLRWAITPPQAWGVYLLAIILVWLVSFYAGSLKPKKAPDGGPPAVTAPKG
ncbi:hypothetical protein JQ554_11405 [Bradyrhizobium diazoefficiens]|jgi:hypothetical protein|nr:hypothetical protein [Bradyrhizobium diazoefficiens]UCF51984.1 MAG: hypothetical protein JSV48_22145 [Bradyrhizobium sp.]MBR0964360.1 hypothetical protein [Bradyrhizobium diazoefficiens]MBR0978520.1 hypothetical protein [Bradyrhizobium diazoefficiens]MBR1008070.1 hypothetical protein [Bradyrhizobium diazoefficiens]MBR1013998.1 hypothetical protein [Bradyrhizobium diazoefficiens]